MLLTIGSVTTAMRLTRLLELEIGHPAEIVHTPSAINKGGCSYSVRFSEQYLEVVRSVVKKYKVPVRKYYSEAFAEGKRVYNALS